LGITVESLDGSPALTTAVSLNSASALGTPALQSGSSLTRVGVAWLDNTVSGLSGDGVLATLSVQIPTGASSNAAYRIHINHSSSSENGLALFRSYVQDGLITLSDRSGSSKGDGISDAWRLRYFGSVSSPLAAATADPDGDGVDNLSEFRAGSNPLDRFSRLRLSSTPSGNGIKLVFPTGTDRNYIIECTPTFGGTWTPIWTNSGDGGVREFTHTPPTGAPLFYRVRAQ
jgi:hypothetical protein